MHLLGIFSTLLKGNKAPIIQEDDSVASLRSDLAEPPTPVRAPPARHQRSIRAVASKKKSVPKKANKNIVKAKRTTRSAKKSVRVVAASKCVKIKSEPHWDRRSRRKSRGYKKGSLSESNLQAKAWKGTGTSSDPYILYQ